MPEKTRTRLILVGASGRMGREISSLAKDHWDVFPVDRDSWTKVEPKNAKVVVDFSSPEGLAHAITWCVKNGKPLVSGTTGLTAEDRKKIQAAGRKIPVLWSANMSIGVHVLAQVLKSLGPVSDWKFQIDETHHIHKKDKPSGTALFLQTELEKDLRRKDLPPPQSKREGEVIGVHRITATSTEEVLRFEHEALARGVFAKGALLAAAWLIKKGRKAGLYGMADVLFRS